MHNNIVTYEPDNSLKKGYFQLFGEIVSEIKSNRWLTYQMFKRNFVAMYKQSFVGILWMIILPIANVGVFAVLNNAGIFNFGDLPVPYPIYAISGMAFWQIFAVGLGSCSNALILAGEMVTRINFSKKSLLFAPMGRTMVSFFIQLVLVGILFLIYRVTPHVGILALPLVVVPIIFLTLGMGFLVSIMNAIVRDFGNALGLCITFLMYLTPVLYVRPEVGLLSYVTKFNPMYYFISNGRSLLISGQFIEVQGFLFSSLFSLIFFVISLVVFHLTETRITERI